MPQRILIALSTTLLLALFSACIVVPVPATKRTSAPPNLNNKIDLTFLAVGTTTRQQVEENLGWSDSGAHAPRLFFGRWSTSSSATLWAIGGYYAGNAGAYRNWEVKNLLVEFDENGVVSQWRIVPDRELVQALAPHALESAGNDAFAAPRNLELEYLRGGKTDPVTITLSRESFIFKVHGRNKHDFEIAPEKITCLSLPGLVKGNLEDPSLLRFAVHFSEKTRAGNEVTVEAAPESLMTTLAYALATNPKLRVNAGKCP